jgi:Holliday junction DNA helicase RuvB
MPGKFRNAAVYQASEPVGSGGSMPRPLPNFNGFVGQDDAVRIVTRQLVGAKARTQPFPHAQFFGPSGVGKTFLAMAIAKEFGTNLIIASGYDKTEDILSNLQKLNVCDFLLVDEAHNMLPRTQEALYSVIDSQCLPEWAGGTSHTPAGAAAASRKINPSTIILATDQPCLLLNAMRKRIALSVELLLYSPQEMKEIVDILASQMDLLLTGQASYKIATLSRGLPRQAKQHLQKLRFHFPDAVQPKIGVAELDDYLRTFGIDDKGLTPLDRAYMSSLQVFGTASIETLAGSLVRSVDWLKQEVESYLLRLHFIKIGARGRQLTNIGIDWLRSSNLQVQTKEEHEHDLNGQTVD